MKGKVRIKCEGFQKSTKKKANSEAVHEMYGRSHHLQTPKLALFQFEHFVAAATFIQPLISGFDDILLTFVTEKFFGFLVVGHGCFFGSVEHTEVH